LEFGCDESEIQKIEGNVKTQIERSIKLAQNASFSNRSELYKEIYS
jgi:TPP-dependent pyruvate/acetoin dehydrogenase alpha subunit